jgi:hypothetical protein
MFGLGMNVSGVSNLIISVIKAQQVIPCITLVISLTTTATVIYYFSFIICFLLVLDSVLSFFCFEYFLNLGLFE